MWILSLFATLAALLPLSTPALPQVATDPAHDSLHWSFEPWVLAGLGLVSVCYGVGVYRLVREVGDGQVLNRWHIAAFVAGVLVLFLALCSPIDTMGEQLFSGHMLQHILLMMVAAPLLVLSRPAVAFIWAFSPEWRKRIARAWNGAGLDRLFKGLLHPLVVFVLFCGAFIFWHLPRPYAWGLQSEIAHSLEHLSFLLTALAFWTIIIEPSGQRRLDYAATLLYLVVTVVVSDMPGALMVLTPRPLYPIHAEGTARFGLTLMQDQQLAGLIMWIPAGAIYIAAAIWLFVRLFHEAERRASKMRGFAAIAMGILTLPLLLGGCGMTDGEDASSARDAERGETLVRQFGCGSCHVVPGIDGATGVVGPPLTRMGVRVYIAGVLRNTPENMVRWLRDPQRIVPNNAMPNMGIDETQARQIAAYLFSLN